VSALADKPRSKADQLGRTLEAWEAKRALLQQRIVDLTREQEQAREEALRQAPTQRPGKLGSRVEKLGRDRAKAEKDLASLEADIAATARVAAEEDAKERRAELDEDIRSAEALRGPQIEALAEFVRRCDAAVDAWRAYVGLAEQRDVFRGEVERSGVLGHATPEQLVAWEQAIREPWMPLPVSFTAAVDQFLLAATRGWANTNAGIRSSALDTIDPGLVPDIRDRDVEPAVSGKVDRAYPLRGF
jgi:hypothetical protein